MTHVLGVYYAPGHNRPTDMDYMSRLQPPAIRILDPDVQHMIDVHRVAPNAFLLPRDWAKSEQHDDIRRDAVGTGKRHAQEWRATIDTWRQQAAQRGQSLPADDRIIVVGCNEPQVWNMLQQTVDYNVAFLDECTRLHLRACALNLSVGWPANDGPDTSPDWTPYAPIEAAIKRGNHFLVLHEYWYRTGPRDGWGWFAGRLQHCPWDVPIIIGECGIDMYVDMQRWENDGKPNRGWRGNVDAEHYAIQMENYARSIDKRVVAILAFLTDYRSNNWESFDTAQAHENFLARKDRMIPEGNGAHEVRLPSIKAPAPAEPVAYVLAPSGANLRAAPVDGRVLVAAPYSAQIRIVGVEQNGWFRVRYGEFVGFMSASLISLVAPEPLSAEPEPSVPQPTATGIIDPLTALAFLQVESGNVPFTNNLLTIRFEVHRFKANLKNDALFEKHFKFTPGNYSEQYWRPTPDVPWKSAHGSMVERHELLRFAERLNQKAAYLSIGMGMAQVMGENHARIGYSNPFAMFKAFSHPRYGVNAQVMGFVDYVLSDPALLSALQRRDWVAAVQKYNGTGQEHIYVPALEKALNAIKQEVGA